MGQNTHLDDGQIGAAWNSITQDNRKDPFSVEGLEKVKTWFLDGFVRDNATVLQTIPDVLYEGIFKDTKRNLYIDYVFQSLTLTSQVLLRMLWHVRVSGKIVVCPSVASKLISFVVIWCHDSAESIARRWRLYDSIGRHENIDDAFMTSFVDWYNLGFVRGNVDHARNVENFPIFGVSFLCDAEKVKLKVDWETNVLYRCACDDPASHTKWVECKYGIDCAGVQWYHAKCTDLIRNNDVCEFCVMALECDHWEDEGSAEGNDENIE
jgi:hypothetical protein